MIHLLGFAAGLPSESRDVDPKARYRMPGSHAGPGVRYCGNSGGCGVGRYVNAAGGASNDIERSWLAASNSAPDRHRLPMHRLARTQNGRNNCSEWGERLSQLGSHEAARVLQYRAPILRKRRFVDHGQQSGGPYHRLRLLP